MLRMSPPWERIQVGGIDRRIRFQTGQNSPSEKRRQIGCTVFPLGSRVRGNDGTFCECPLRGRGFRRGGRTDASDSKPDKTPHPKSVARSVALSFLWVPAFAGMTARFANVSSVGEDSGEGDRQRIRFQIEIPRYLTLTAD